ncbi:MAG: polymer-forming cytoskeletal protein [Wenzhouxiangellaceae bacterium]
MGIFGKNRAQSDSGTGTTVIGAGTELVGDLTLTDRLHVDGRIEGDIRSTATITVGEKGRLEGKVEAQTVIVSGQVSGSIAATQLEILSGGNVQGDVHVANLVIEPGGRFNGSSEIVSEAVADQPANAPKTAPAAGSDAAADTQRPGSSKVPASG